jgi:alkanesulfonate monooxygenase SsuD/methylene tetrahydromethanopterin reductase-like flavin-dependent oxidoreductase (luciferase family)
MNVSFTLFTNKAEEMPRICEHAEGIGFSHAWVGEHIVAPAGDAIEHPYGGRQRPPVVASDNRFYDLWLTIGAILERTKKLKVHTGVCVLPLRHPLITARACLTAHRIASNRFGLGVGAGWLESEFAALGVPFQERWTRMEESIGILRQIFSGIPAAHAGPHYPFPVVQMTEAAVDIPIFIGGKSPAAIRRAARFADGWVGMPIPFDETIAIKKGIDRARSDLGFGHRPFAFFPRLFEPIDRDTVTRFQDAGFENVVITWDMLHPEDPRETSLDHKRRKLDAVQKTLGLMP